MAEVPIAMIAVAISVVVLAISVAPVAVRMVAVCVVPQALVSEAGDPEVVVANEMTHVPIVIEVAVVGAVTTVSVVDAFTWLTPRVKLTAGIVDAGTLATVSVSEIVASARAVCGISATSATNKKVASGTIMLIAEFKLKVFLKPNCNFI